RDPIVLAPEEEVPFLLEAAVDLFAEPLIEIGHPPTAELETLGWILPRPAGRLHDSIHGDLGADNDLSHGSFSLIAAKVRLPKHLECVLHRQVSPTTLASVIIPPARSKTTRLR